MEAGCKKGVMTGPEQRDSKDSQEETAVPHRMIAAGGRCERGSMSRSKQEKAKEKEVRGGRGGDGDGEGSGEREKQQ